MQRLWLQEGARDAALRQRSTPRLQEECHSRAGLWSIPNSENPSESQSGDRQRGPASPVRNYVCNKHDAILRGGKAIRTIALLMNSGSGL